MKKKTVIRLFAYVLALAMPLVTALVSFADNEAIPKEPYTSETKYDSPDINKLTGLGEEPEDISVTAGAKYLEKAWYEYVTYSDKAVSSYRLNDTQRLLFYDPYTYINSMVMDVQFDAATTEFDTMSSYEISKTSTRTMTACVESTETYTNATQTSGRDKTYLDVKNGGTTKTTYNHTESTATVGKVTDREQYHYKDQTSLSVTLGETIDVHTTTTVGVEAGVAVDVGSQTTFEETIGVEWLTDYVDHETIYDPGYSTTTTYSGDATVEDHTTSITEGWTELSARVTKTLGSARSTSNSWSDSESVTVTKTYAATHFSSDGVTPLPWAIVHYEVQMPMKCCLQVRSGNEWITMTTIYCMLTTVKGTCRAWIENGQVYYEDWGSGEPVVATDFWGQFMTREQLMNAYSNKLYPVGGEG